MDGRPESPEIKGHPELAALSTRVSHQRCTVASDWRHPSGYPPQLACARAHCAQHLRGESLSCPNASYAVTMNRSLPSIYAVLLSTIKLTYILHLPLPFLLEIEVMLSSRQRVHITKIHHTASPHFVAIHQP